MMTAPALRGRRHHAMEGKAMAASSGGKSESGGVRIGDKEVRRATTILYAAWCGALVVWAASCGNGASSCPLSVSPTRTSQPASGGAGTLAVSTGASCSWTAASDADWITVGAAGGQGGGTVNYGVAPNPAASARTGSIKVVHTNGQGTVALHHIDQQGTVSSSRLRMDGAYTFSLEAGGACGWPVTAFLWPVSVEVSAIAQDTSLGSVIFPPTPSAPNNRWAIQAGPDGTSLVPGQESPGPAAAAYDLVVDGGRWEAGGPTRARDGRGEITSGTASGARLTLVLPGTDKRWECRASAKWSLLTRWVDHD